MQWLCAALVVGLSIGPAPVRALRSDRSAVGRDTMNTMQMTVRQRIAEFLFIGLWCSIAVFGFQFLPSEDYQPSRPIYAAAWFVAWCVLAFFFRKSPPWLRSATRSLVCIFAFLLLVSILMKDA